MTQGEGVDGGWQSLSPNPPAAPTFKVARSRLSRRGWGARKSGDELTLSQARVQEEEVVMWKRIRTKAWQQCLATGQSFGSFIKAISEVLWRQRKASASAMGREVILEVRGGWGTEKWGYNWGCERREFFMFIFYADGNDSGERGKYWDSIKETEGVPQGVKSCYRPTGGRNWHLVRQEISNSLHEREGS